MQHTPEVSKSQTATPQEARSQTATPQEAAPQPGSSFLERAIPYRSYRLLIRPGKNRHSVIVFDPNGMVIQIVEESLQTRAWKEAAYFVDREIIRQTSVPGYQTRIERALDAAGVTYPRKEGTSQWHPDFATCFQRHYGVLPLVNRLRAERLECLCTWVEGIGGGHPSHRRRLPEAARDAYHEAARELQALEEQAAALRFEGEANGEATDAEAKDAKATDVRRRVA